ncbi:MAG: sugar transferase [Bacteroidetes bacterium 4572_112]|nr:MAG: sugar transferase [Bacteroidetes bacterium 4572_112]
MLFTVLLFTFFSVSTIFNGPIFLFIFSLSFLIRYQEISDLIIDVNIEKPTSKFLKENVDYFVSTIVFFVFSPIWIIVSFAILLSDGRPILFSQMRVGQNGKLFRLYKFRSMKNAKSNTTVAAAETNRISKLGHFLRRSKIDELPELFNIMRGDMSFVGPRPDVPGYADALKGKDKDILKLKPGLTGPASLKYYDEEELLAAQDDPQKYNDEVIFPDKVRINLLYMKNWTFWMDMKFILMTALKRPFKDEDVL